MIESLGGIQMRVKEFGRATMTVWEAYGERIEGVRLRVWEGYNDSLGGLQ